MLISLGYLPKQIRGSVCCLIANPHKQSLRLMFFFCYLPERTWQGLLRTHSCLFFIIYSPPLVQAVLINQNPPNKLGELHNLPNTFHNSEIRIMKLIRLQHWTVCCLYFSTTVESQSKWRSPKSHEKHTAYEMTATWTGIQSKNIQVK